MKKRALVILITICILLVGCNIGETKVDYERLIKALDEGDMATVMSTSDDGYAYVEERVNISTREESNDKIYDDLLYQSTEGVINVKEKRMYGTTNQRLKNIIETKIEGKRDKDIKENIIYTTPFIYENGTAKGGNRNIESLLINIGMNRLRGISSIIPKYDTAGGDEPNRISYSLTESEFQTIINDDLKIKYDELNSAKITIYFTNAEDCKGCNMTINDLRISIDYNKENEQGKLLSHTYNIDWIFVDKESNKEVSKEKYSEFEKDYNKSIKE
ncbi:DUF3952 domain-containing protein [Priestia taiwanensis]|uniref:DUF3952 domain-containing protein n=1 Tax=Priestia taiwanensis TaxID=1347902 RepID=A0A917AK65_9BACI|nr:DUF3952 domain-containing protein [Priestia taiwanensis]MBM7361579.1 hypothetical protein [Priestia taiwanensis]GGE55290.1 hypothetical protein GCM10007140_02040 [Priestia taiwanensis]